MSQCATIKLLRTKIKTPPPFLKSLSFLKGGGYLVSERQPSCRPAGHHVSGIPIISGLFIFTKEEVT